MGHGGQTTHGCDYQSAADGGPAPRLEHVRITASKDGALDEMNHEAEGPKCLLRSPGSTPVQALLRNSGGSILRRVPG